MTFDYIEKNPLNEATKEAYWVISNLIETAGMELRIELTREYDLGKKLANMLKQVTNVPKLWKIVLFSIEKIMQIEEFFQETSEFHPIYSFDLAGGIDCLHDLELGPNTEIFSVSQKILDFISQRTKSEMIDMQNENVGNIHF